MTFQTIPACKDCKHYKDYKYFDGSCNFHTHKVYDYINGRVNKFGILVINAREDEDLCGLKGRDFKPLQVVEEEETFSYRKWIKGFFTDQWMF